MTPARLLGGMPGVWLVPSAHPSHPQKCTIGFDGILYVGGSGNNTLARVNAAGVSLGTVRLTFPPGDLVMNPVDGTLWVSGYFNDLVEHIRLDGTVLGSVPTYLNGSFSGIGLAQDNRSLYVTTASSAVVEHFDLNGNLIGSFAEHYGSPERVDRSARARHRRAPRPQHRAARRAPPPGRITGAGRSQKTRSPLSSISRSALAPLA